MRLVADKSNDHAVEVEEEHEQMEAQLDEGFLSAYTLATCAITRPDSVILLPSCAH